MIVPTYNRAHLISRSIRSVLSQTFTDLELILVDDGSIDNTRKVVEGFQKADGRVRYVHQDNSGAPARPKNLGIKISLGEYIAFLDDDDEWLSDKLEKQLSLFENSPKLKLGLVGCGVAVLNAKGDKLYEFKMPKTDDYIAELLRRNFIFTSSCVVVKKEVFKNIGLHDERFRMGDDWDMWVRIAQNYAFDFVHEPLTKYYRHENNASKLLSEENRIGEYENEFEKYKHLFRRYPLIYSKRLVALGHMYLLSSNKGKARDCFRKAIMMNPTNPRGYIHFFLSFGGSNSHLFYAWVKEHFLDRLVRITTRLRE